MSALSGILPIGDYSSGSDADKIATLLSLIPDPDATHGTGAVGGGNQGILNTYLDEMGPGAAAQLRVELLALTTGLVVPDVSASDEYVADADDASANEITIDTGLATTDPFTTLIVSIERAGASVKADAVVTDNEDGTFTISEDTTYSVTAGDTVSWYALV